MGSFVAADEERLDETLHRLARQIAADLDGRPVVVGIRRRGVPLAHRLVEQIDAQCEWNCAVGEISLKRYADDLTVLHPQPKLAEESLSIDVDGAVVLLVDDVLYTGRTLLRAAEFILEAGAARVHCAVLCVRNQPEVPVAADFTGMRLDVGSDSVIELHIPPYEDDLAVMLLPREEAS